MKLYTLFVLCLLLHSLCITSFTASVKPEEESLLQKSPKQDHVVKLLHEHIYEYDRIGQLLGVDFGTRQRIKLDFTTPTALGKMNSIVNEWSTKQTYDVTWEHFIKAMKDGDFSKLPGEIEGFIERDDIKQEYAKEKEWVDIRGKCLNVNILHISGMYY